MHNQYKKTANLRYGIAEYNSPLVYMILNRDLNAYYIPHRPVTGEPNPSGTPHTRLISF